MESVPFRKVDPSAVDWFDPNTGDPQVWYYQLPNGEFEFYSRPGFHPFTKDPLKPVTKNLYQTWLSRMKQRAELEAAQKAELAAAEAAQASEKAAADAAREAQRLEFYAEPQSIHAGEKAMLRWNTGATSVRIQAVGSGELGTFAREGTHEIMPTSDTSYELTATGPAGEKTARITVTVLPTPPPTITTSVNPQRIRLGEDCRIAWSATNATNVRFEGGGDYAPSSSATVKPSHVGPVRYVLNPELRKG